MQRRIDQVTTSCHVGMDNEQIEKKEEKDRIHISFKRKDNKRQYITRDQRCKKEKKKDAAADTGNAVPQRDEEAEAAREEDIDSLKKEEKGKGSSSKTSPRNRNEESKRTTFTVLQKNMKSMSSNERLEELISELYRVEWDMILLSETWRQSKEVWETQQGHIVVESGQFVNKHGVAILSNRRWKNQINWVQCECEHATQCLC